ncbi:Vegetative incompatibility protein HET-E-1 like [Verticillium longisporum]|nr:Vegetative incompatibility protein HET-E-1 like [Verticillium longisporum]
MRLINVRTKEITLFYGHDTPPYAILSHTWAGDNEVSHQEWTAPLRPTFKPGYRKIMAACWQAEQDGLDYLWVDTNCIDKTSSAELSEAINSMFAWYEASAVCYAYLSDVDELKRKGPTLELRASRWFTRGWTLQELLAPPKLTFFNRHWKDIGTRQELRFPISTITGIDVTYLGQSQKIFSASVAARLSWAAKRETTRVEDMAYCLLGIFDIHLPLIYGEGSKAFLRLQEEIIKNSDDQTIFCWTWEADMVPHGWLSLLAPSPAVFDSGKFVPAPGNHSSAPYQITNVGLRIRLPVVLAVHTVCAVLDVVTMISEVRNLYILCKTPRDTSGISILPYRPRFEYGFHITVRISGFEGNDPPLSVDCLVPQYPQSPFSHISTPVYSVVGFRGPLQSDINILVLRIRYKDQKIPILLSVGMRGGRPTWHCEILPYSFLAYSTERWLVEIDKMRQQSQGHSLWYHRVRNVGVALDRENLDASGRYVRYVYVVIGDRGLTCIVPGSSVVSSTNAHADFGKMCTHIQKFLS